MIDYCTLKQTLETKLAELIERAEGIEEVLSEPGDKDWEENAISKENDQALVAIENAIEVEIRDIKLAIKRIDSGEYGSCVGCHQPIAKARLEALPWASTCVRCSA